MEKKITIFAGVLGLLVLAAGTTSLLSLSRSIEQPIAFNHHLHVEEVGLDCTDCHAYARSGSRATIPNIDLCSGCHEETAEGSEDLARLVTYIESETPIPWRKVYWVPDHVFFSHRRHTSIAGLECETCHGKVEQREEPVVRQTIQITMDRCMECHEESGASNDCIDCHR